MSPARAVLVWAVLGVAGALLYVSRVANGFYPDKRADTVKLWQTAKPYQKVLFVVGHVAALAGAAALGPIRLGVELATTRDDT